MTEKDKPEGWGPWDDDEEIGGAFACSPSLMNDEPIRLSEEGALRLLELLEEWDAEALGTHSK